MHRTLLALLLALGCTQLGLAQEPNTTFGSFRVNGFDDGTYPLSVTLDVNAISLAVLGNPGLPFAIAEGPSNPGLLSTLSGQKIDIGSPPFGTDVRFVMNGAQPSTLLDLLAHTGPQGQFSLAVATDVSLLPPGFLTSWQVIILDPSRPDGFELTAATRLFGPTVLCGTPIPNVGDDTAHPLLLSNFPFSFYGVAYSICYVGSNGFVTFQTGSTDFTETNAEMNSQQPRIAPLWNDWSPNQGGTVSVFQDASHTRVCWNGVRSFGGTDSNTFRVDLTPDGLITFTYGAVPMQGVLFDGIAGISAGGNQGVAQSPINLSACVGNPSTAQHAKDPRFENFAQSPAGFDLQFGSIHFAPAPNVFPADGPYTVF